MKGALLDVDGTLVDSNDAHAEAWVRTFREFGYDRISFDLVRPLIGMGGDKLLPKMSGLDHDSEPARLLSARRKELFLSEYVSHLRAFPGVPELLDRMRSDGLQLVIATSAKEDELQAILEQTALGWLLPKRTSSSDAENSKPDPDIIHAALERGALAPDDAILLGDTPYDIEAGQRSGVSVVAVRSGGWDDRALAGAVAIYESAADLLHRYDSSPFPSQPAATVSQR